MTTASPGAKDLALAQARVALHAFLDAECTLDCRPSGPPRVSILLLLWNRAELTLSCLQTLALQLNDTPYEIVVIDNGSRDETGLLLDRIEGLKVVRNQENIGFPRGVNQAAQLASGEYLLLLNNDTQVLGRAIDVAANFLAADASVGAVGGKIILLDGTLQEAGCTMCRNGWPYPYGRGAAPDGPAFLFQREVDYCSGAFLMTRREVFARLGGLDELFSPGYFEDVDYCIRVRQEGLRVVYLPEAAILHYENGSSSTVSDLSDLVLRNHRRFSARYAEWLHGQPTDAVPPLLLRTGGNALFNVLLLGDGLVKGQVAEQALATLQALVARIQALDGFVTLSLSGAAARTLRTVLGQLPKTVEVYCREQPDSCDSWLATQAANYDLVVAADAGSLRPFLAQGITAPRCAILRDERFTPLEAAALAAASPTGGSAWLMSA
jgi:O-antigen biosynthesis protein